MTEDDFLGGRVRAAQPAVGYRAGTDAVLLAAAVPAKPGQSVLELGCGAGVASLCLAVRVPDLRLTGIERQLPYAGLARTNAARNGVKMEIVTADITNLPASLRGQSFDHVFANPPYYLRTRGSAACDPGREAALGEETPLSQWMDVATRRLVPGGWLTVIQRVERLPDLMQALDDRLGSAELLPLAPRQGRAAKLGVLRARKGARGAFRLLPPLVLHMGARHETDGESYTPPVRAVLRQAAALPWPGD
ncbi:tRNA1(Val) A37 N6-methylase TrmN6 [Rhodovulum imhoffii]|uniref:tRNA1(Val) A37 N6-methylase TrmN6 n=1 Tax=Rhodovulum imhoffii TaxID=365340 RepID=A0A2T5BUE3_9RHOB|nr:methyltransferase [Rhodovulum imhoffii]MBK5934495.1 methyltransferase [Rhodovulum imhoffii]PTN03088.1 tRNA1(Val) A37 N6-methylase TrmN6 [Rhodovulum imhoffii]